MDPLKSLEKVLKSKDPMGVASYDDYSTEAKMLLQELQYVKSIEKISMVLYTVFTKQFSKKEATRDWKPIAQAILDDKVLAKHVGRLIK